MIHTDYSNPVQMRRSYKFLLRPTSKQADALAACLEDHRQLYNAALEERREAWKMRRVSVSYYAQASQLTAIRAADRNGQGRWSCGSQQYTLRQLDATFQRFFRRAQAGEKCGYPRFKSPARLDSMRWSAVKHGARWDPQPRGSATRVYLLGIGHVRVHNHRAVAGQLKQVIVKREGRRWFVILACDDVSAQPLPATGAVVGIDLGVASFLTTSDGAHVPSPRLRMAAGPRLVEAQRALARKKPGSARRKKAAERVVMHHGKIRRARLDHAHKLALKLVRDHDVIAHEDLRIRNMMQRPKPRPAADGTYERNGAAAKSSRTRSIQDAGWAIFLNVLRDKAESAGRVVIEVDARYTSQRCSECGHVAAGNRVTQAAFRCLSCGHEAHADVNAAINILRAGLARQDAQAA